MCCTCTRTSKLQEHHIPLFKKNKNKQESGIYNNNNQKMNDVFCLPLRHSKVNTMELMSVINHSPM